MKQTSLQSIPSHSKASDDRSHKKTGKPRGRPKTKLEFHSARELNDMVGLYIEEKLFDIVEQYQYEIIQYFEEMGMTVTYEDSYYDDINDDRREGKDYMKEVFCNAIDEATMVATRKDRIKGDASCRYDNEDNIQTC